MKKRSTRNCSGISLVGTFVLTPNLFAKWLGEDSAIDPRWLHHGVLEFAPTEERQSWVYVTTGMSNPWETDAPQEFSGMGCEFMMETLEQSDWAITRLASMMAHQLLIASGHYGERPWLNIGDRVPLVEAVDGGSNTLTSLLITEPRVGVQGFSLQTGTVRLFQFVGVTEREREFVSERGLGLLKQQMATDGVWPLTVPDRKCLADTVMSPKDKDDTDYEQVKIEIRTTIDGEVFVETPWADDLGDNRYRLDNSLFDIYGLSWHDIVEARREDADGFPVMTKLLEKSGNQTLWLDFDCHVGDTQDIQPFLDHLVEMGCSYEGMNGEYVSLNVPPELGWRPVAEYLNSVEIPFEHADPTFEELYGKGKWNSDYISFSNDKGYHHVVLSEKPEGAYIFIYETEASKFPEKDYLEDNMDVTIKICEEDYGVPRASWERHYVG